MINPNVVSLSFKLFPMVLRESDLFSKAGNFIQRKDVLSIKVLNG